MTVQTRAQTLVPSPHEVLAGDASETLHELTWAWEAPLELTQGSPHPRERWLLNQGPRPVVAISPAGTGWWRLRAAAEEWTAAVRRRPRRLGWYLEVAKAGEREPVLHYRPATLPGGSLHGAGDARYKLRPPRLRADWTLRAARGPELAHIMHWAKPPRESVRVSALRPGLVRGAAVEPNLLLLIAACSVAIVIYDQQPVCRGCC